MDKIGVKQLKTIGNNGTKGSFTINDLSFEFKTYLPIQEKMSMIESILLSVFYDEDGLYEGLNSFKLEIIRSYMLAKYYLTNISLPKKDGVIDIQDSYDILVSSGALNQLKYQLNLTGEYNDLNTLLNNRVADIIEGNKDSAIDNMRDLIDILRDREDAELMSTVMQNKQMEIVIDMMPDDPDKAREFVDKMVKDIDRIPQMEGYDAMKNVSKSNENGKVAKLVKEVSKKNGKDI